MVSTQNTPRRPNSSNLREAGRCDLSLRLARYGEPFSEREYARQVVALLSDEPFKEGTAFGFKSQSDTVQLD